MSGNLGKQNITNNPILNYKQSNDFRNLNIFF